MSSIAIIGGGASGLIAAIYAAKNGHKVTLFEKNNKLGKKILATGNGRCNITNKIIDISNFHSKNITFVQDVLNKFPLEDTLKFFESIGLLVVEGEKKNRLYPMSLQATSVVDLLEHQINQLGIMVKTNSHITLIQNANNQFLLTVNDQFEYNFDKVIIATGALAQSKLGGCDDGFKFAINFKHNLISTSPTLVQLVSKSNYLQQISGVKINGTVKLFVNKQQIIQSTGDILFAKYGLSGSTILEISREVAIELQKNSFVEVSLDLMPQYSKNELKVLLEKRYNQFQEKNLNELLEGILNKKLISMIVEQSKNDINKVSTTLKNLTFNITDTKGFDSSEVCAGGIDTLDISSNTMESLKQKGLYFCGEVLDVDGDCGGFNLQWAWSSGYLAGSSV